jgi:para-aminobenzoate synthetase component 1
VLEREPPELVQPSIQLWHPEEPRELHLLRIQRALEHIARGDVYEVNLARRLAFELTGTAASILQRLLERTDGAFSAALALGEVDVVATSPELFLELSSRGGIRSTPIKGTRPRGMSPELDQRLLQELASDPKEAAELIMVVDVVRNDLGRVAKVGSVRVPEPARIETHRTVHHRVADVYAELAPGRTRAELLRSMLPSGSVTGAPKARAMQLIGELEAQRRGLYTGAFGWLGQDGGLCLGMAIRTLVRHRASGQAHYFTGGGIVSDSDPARELLETDWKASHLDALA